MTQNFNDPASAACALQPSVVHSDADGAITLQGAADSAADAAFVKADGANTLAYAGQTALTDDLSKTAQFQAAIESVDAESSFSAQRGSQGTAPVALPRTKPSGAAGKSLRIHLIIKPTDLGLEPLYQQLAEIDNKLDRIIHVRRVLHHIGVHGEISRISPAPAGSVSGLSGASRRPSFMIIFRISWKDVGLEKLYAELSLIDDVAERNQHVRRCLFNAYCLLAQPRSSAALPLPMPMQPSPDAMALAHSNPAKPDTGVLISSWSNASPTEAQEPDAVVDPSERKRIRKGIRSSLEPKKP